MIKYIEDKDIPGLALLAQQVIATAILDVTISPTSPEEEENRHSAFFLTGDGDPEEQGPYYLFWSTIMGETFMVPNPEILGLFVEHSGKKSMKAAIGGRL